jgi:hypothetical protein
MITETSDNLWADVGVMLPSGHDRSRDAWWDSLVGPVGDKKRVLIPWLSILMAWYLQTTHFSSQGVLVVGSGRSMVGRSPSSWWWGRGDEQSESDVKHDLAIRLGEGLRRPEDVEGSRAMSSRPEQYAVRRNARRLPGGGR